MKSNNRKPIFTILTAALILIFAFLLLCVIPGGDKVLGVVLPIPKGVPIPQTLPPITFGEVSPPVEGQVSRIILPIGGTSVDIPDYLPPAPTPTPTPVPELCPPGAAVTVAGDPCPPPGVPPTERPPKEKPPITRPLSDELLDFGDAPDSPFGGFPSFRASDGARHRDTTKFYLGDRVDTEPDSHQVDRDSPNPVAGLDDGLSALQGAFGTAAWTLIVKITNAGWDSGKPIYLNVLYDFDGSFSWEVPEEHIVVDKEFFLEKGTSVFYSIPVLNPLDILYYVRATVTDIPLGADYDGSWSAPFDYGETEDYSTARLPSPHIMTISAHNLPFTIIHKVIGTYIYEPEPKIIPPPPPLPVQPGIDIPTLDPRLWTPIIENGAVVDYHAEQDFRYQGHDVKKSDKLSGVGITFEPFDPGLLGLPPPTGAPSRRDFPDYNLTGTHNRETTEEITIRHNGNDTKYYYPDGTEFDDYETYDIPRPLLLLYQLPERGADGEPPALFRILKVATSPFSPILELFAENIQQVVRIQLLTRSRPQPTIIREQVRVSVPVQVRVPVPVIIQPQPQPTLPQPPAVVAPQNIVEGEGAFTSDNKVTIKYKATNVPVKILFVPINRFGQEIAVEEKALTTVLSGVIGEGTISIVLPQISGAVAFYVKLVDDAGKQLAVTSNALTYFAVGGAAPTETAAAADTTAPAAVTNLTRTGLTQTSVTLDWTAPGDDGNTGTAASYDVRYLIDEEVTEANWETATQATGEPTPSIAGTVESFAVTNLVCGTRYRFALKTSDEVPNVSDISNSPLGITSAC